jgi:hypothetical protein
MHACTSQFQVFELMECMCNRLDSNVHVPLSNVYIMSMQLKQTGALTRQLLLAAVNSV